MAASNDPPPLPPGPPAPAGTSPDARRDRNRLLLDAAAAIGLLAALGLVFLFGRSSASRPGLQSSSAEEVNQAAHVASEPAVRASLRLAVTKPPNFENWDDMGALLRNLGQGYQYTQISLDDLLESEKLEKYDVVFVACSPVPKTWVVRRVRPGLREDTAVFAARPDVVARLNQSLRRFVAGGGTLYASDWQFDLLALAFPEMIDEAKVGRGEVQKVAADVVDPGLRKRLGATIPLRFEKSDWRPAAFTGRNVTTYLKGEYRLTSGGRQSGPLLVSFPVDEGTVIFTSFHNEAQNNDVEKELLRYLVFTTVTAREESRVKRTMVRGGLSPQERNLLSASSGGQPVGDRYELAKAGRLQFALGFEDQGARLRLEVAGPDGRKEEKSDSKTFTIDIPDAKPGVWSYTVTPLAVPYKDFPFTLTIGEERR
jgi:hypothetical protein